MAVIMKKQSKKKTVITVKPSYKRRVPHKPTRPHRDKTKYTRKGKPRNRRHNELRKELSGS